MSSRCSVTESCRASVVIMPTQKKKTSSVRNVQKTACETKSTPNISLTSLFLVTVIVLVIGIWLNIFYWIGVVLAWILFVMVVWRLLIRRECADGGTRISLLSLVLIGIVFLVLGMWIWMLNIIGTIFIVIAFIVFIWRLLIYADKK